jgi:hypothetical protein
VLQAVRWIAIVGLIAGCADTSGGTTAVAPEAHAVFGSITTEMVVGDERLFLFTNDALVSVPKAGGAALTIAPRVEGFYAREWHPLSRGGAYVVAAQDIHGPVALVDQHTSQIIATWKPPANFRTEPWAIRSVATDGDRVFIAIQEADGSSVLALAAPALAGPPETLVRYGDVVTDRDEGAFEKDSVAVKQVVADGASIYYHLSLVHLRVACPTCGGVVEGERNVLVRLGGGVSKDVYQGGRISRIALADDAIWALESTDDPWRASLKRIPKDGGPIGNFEVDQAGLLTAFGTTAFVPTGRGYSDGTRSVGAGVTTLLRAPGVVYALAVDNDFVYASIVISVDDCPSGGKGCLGRTRIVHSGIDRMPRAR